MKKGGIGISLFRGREMKNVYTISLCNSLQFCPFFLSLSLIFLVSVENKVHCKIIELRVIQLYFVYFKTSNVCLFLASSIYFSMKYKKLYLVRNRPL